MLSEKILAKLESRKDLPTIPATASAVLQSIDDPNASAASLARIIERDVSLTARVLAVANSPFYGLLRKVSTVELALVILGLSAVKEILLSLVVQRIFANMRTDLLDVRDFWNYSVYCGSTARFLARKLGYRVAGEAFVAGLIHDIGILIIAQFLPKEFTEIRRIQNSGAISYNEAEQYVLGNSHNEVGLWFAERWNLPEQLRCAIYCHHWTTWSDETLPSMGAELLHKESPEKSVKKQLPRNVALENRVLTSLVGLSEFFAINGGFTKWMLDEKKYDLFIHDDLLAQVQSTFNLEDDESLVALLNTLHSEYELAGDMAMAR